MNDIQAILTSDQTGQQLVQFSKKLGERLYKGNLKTNQIRKVFTEVRKIEALWERENQRNTALRRLVMLKPKLAYQEKRQEKRGTSPVQPLNEALTRAIDVIASEKSPEKQDVYFRRFVEFFEAVLAYHKYFGGRDS